MPTATTLLPFQPATMSTAQLSAVSFLARYSARTHHLNSFQLREWFAWCERNGLDPLVGLQRAHVELYLRSLGERGLMDSSVVSMMNGVRGSFRFAHIDGLIPADPAVYAGLPKVQRDESHTQCLDRHELIRSLQVAQTITVHHGALAYLLDINALRASEAAAVRIEDYADTLRGHRVIRLVGKGNKPATMPITIAVLRVLEACRGPAAHLRCPIDEEEDLMLSAASGRLDVPEIAALLWKSLPQRPRRRAVPDAAWLLRPLHDIGVPTTWWAPRCERHAAALSAPSRRG